MLTPAICPQVSWNGVRRLILGSKSWSRNTLLQQLEPPPYEVIAADIDEEAVEYKKDDAQDMVYKIALAKAIKLMSLSTVTKQTPLPSNTGTGTGAGVSTNNVLSSSPMTSVTDEEDDIEREEGRVLMICGDAVVKHKDTILGKPKSKDEAIQLLNSYQDAPVTTVSSIVVVDVVKKCYWREIDEAEVYFRKLPADVIEKVISEEGGGLQSAGALRIEMPEVQPYIDCIVGDISAVMGFSQPVFAKLIGQILIDESEGIPL